MEENQVIFSRITNKLSEAIVNDIPINTHFFSLDEKSEIIDFLRKRQSCVKVVWYGGFNEAERTIAVFMPDSCNIDEDDTVSLFESFIDNPLSAIRISKDKFSELTHRDYLGALMSLGIKREMLGDILVDNDGAIIICISSISRYIIENLNKIGNSGVKCETVSINNICKGEDSFELKFHSVASLRLDNIVSCGFNVSRRDSTVYIEKGLVFVNSERIYKNNYNVKCTDKVVLRKKGKIIIDTIVGESKKGRLHILIKHFK